MFWLLVGIEAKALQFEKISKIFADSGFHTCLLKGQGNALYYPNPFVRQSGDIGLWVEGKCDDVVWFVHSLGVNIHDIHMVHATAEFFLMMS